MQISRRNQRLSRQRRKLHLGDVHVHSAAAMGRLGWPEVRATANVPWSRPRWGARRHRSLHRSCLRRKATRTPGLPRLVSTPGIFVHRHLHRPLDSDRAERSDGSRHRLAQSLQLRRGRRVVLRIEFDPSLARFAELNIRRRRQPVVMSCNGAPMDRCIH